MKILFLAIRSDGDNIPSKLEINKYSLAALISEVNKKGGNVKLSVGLDTEEGKFFTSGKVDAFLDNIRFIGLHDNCQCKCHIAPTSLIEIKGDNLAHVNYRVESRLADDTYEDIGSNNERYKDVDYFDIKIDHV